jgi:kumamolisin
MIEARELPVTAPSSEKADASMSLRKEVESGNNRPRTVEERVELSNTRVDKQPDGTRIGPTDPSTEICSTIMVRSKASEKEMNETLARIACHKQKPLSDEEFNARFGADPEAMKRVLKFVADNGLTVDEVDPNSGRVLLRGKVKNFNDAFKIELDDFKGPLGVSRERTATMSVPREVGSDILGVFGLESRPQRPQVISNCIRLKPTGWFHPRTTSGYMPGDVANAYQFPQDSMGGGQSVAIVEFGGGLDLKDNETYYQQHGLKVPDINIVSVDGAKSKLGQAADDEVALDSQMIGVVAPDAKQMLIFAPNSDQGFVDAITRATFTKEGETGNSAISISWGAPESDWSTQAKDNLALAFKKAALKGISIFAATGDKGAKNGTNRFTADYPAADPSVTGTGGTELTLNGDGTIAKEVGWNNSGGGISELNPVPDFQSDIKMPPNANHDSIIGRGVPDICGDASPSTGFKIRVRGQETVMGGTSAVAPLYAALVMRMNGALGQRVGYLNPFLYKNGTSAIFKDITAGNNGYEAGAGWDAVTGWGVINGKALQDALKADLKK